MSAYSELEATQEQAFENMEPLIYCSSCDEDISGLWNELTADKHGLYACPDCENSG